MKSSSISREDHGLAYVAGRLSYKGKKVEIFREKFIVSVSYATSWITIGSLVTERRGPVFDPLAMARVVLLEHFPSRQMPVGRKKIHKKNNKLERET